MVQQGSSGRAAEFGFAFIYMGIYFFFICDDHYKLLFLYLFVMDYVMILRTLSSFLEVRLFYYPDMNFFSWRSTLIVLVSTFVSAPFMLHFFARTAVNAVLTYYAEEARKQKIDFDVTCPLPEQLPAHEPEICALLGNLLENAIDSCKELTNTAPFIRIAITCKGHIMLFTVDNSCQSKPKQKNGRFLFTKHDGYGTGTYSVKATAERSGGSVKFEYKDGVFYTSVLLYGNLS